MFEDVTFISIQELPVAQALEVGKHRESESFEEEDIRCRETGEYRSFVDRSKSSDIPVRLTVDSPFTIFLNLRRLKCHLGQ